MKLKPIGVKVNGKMIGLERYLLEMPFRPIPKEPTHYIVVDVLNNDLSIKRLTIYFNEADTWVNPDSQFGQNNSKAVGTLIGNHLGFLSLDKAAIAYRYWVMLVQTNELVLQSAFIYQCKDFDY